MLFLFEKIIYKKIEEGGFGEKTKRCIYIHHPQVNMILCQN